MEPPGPDHHRLSVPEIVAREQAEAEAPRRFAALEAKLAELGIDKRALEDWIAAKLRS